MKHHFLTVLITIILAFQFACTEKVESAGTESPFSPTIPKETPTPEKDEFWYEKVDVSQKQLSYKGYKFSKKIKKVRVENDVIINDNYVLVTKNGKKITEFYDFAESQLAEYQFGLFPMLGDENNKQMIVEATLPKSWRYWIIDFSPEFRIIFDSSKYNLGHDLRLLDINRDGKRELQLDLMTFNYFGINRRYGWVTPPMIFQFDEK